MAVVHVTQDSFASTVESSPIVIVDFWAAWCGPCKSYGPIFEAVSNKHPDITFAKVDTDAEQELAGTFGVQSIPSTLFVRDGLPLHLQPGLLRAGDLDNLIQQVRDLDMEKVRADYEAQVARG